MFGRSLAVILGLLVCLGSRGQEGSPDYGNAYWGMSKADVREVENPDELFEDSGKELKYLTSSDGVEMVIVYTFVNDKLVGVTEEFLHPHVVGDVQLDFIGKSINSLEFLYGKSVDRSKDLYTAVVGLRLLGRSAFEEKIGWEDKRTKVVHYVGRSTVGSSSFYHRILYLRRG